jgi:hypothetical protein
MDTDRSSDQLNALTIGLSRRAVLSRALVGGVAAASLPVSAGRGNARAQATPGPSDEEGGEANHFVLAGGEVQITYDTTGFAGEPQLTYRGPIGVGPIDERPIESRTIVGDEISTEQTSIGRLITVYLDAMPDAATFFLTLLLPDFNPMVLGAAPVSFATLAMLTTLRTTIAGPGLLEGALQEYVAVPLEGTAEFVVF